MTHQGITVIIPPEIQDYDECYSEVVEYVAACTGLNWIRDDLHAEDSISCDAYFEDIKGNKWHGQLCYPPLPDGSQKYIVHRGNEAGE